MRLLFLTALSILTVTSMAQKFDLKVTEAKKGIGNGYNNALVISIYEVGDDVITKKWKSEMKKLKAKVSSKKEIVAINAYMNKMGDKPFDVYATVTSKDKGVFELNVAVDLGGAFLSSSMHSEQYEVMENFVYTFARDLVTSAVEDQVKTAGKDLSKKEKEFEKLVDENKTLHNNIKKWENSITVAEQDIVQNSKDQETKKKEIEDSKKVLEYVESKLKSIK